MDWYVKEHALGPTRHETKVLLRPAENDTIIWLTYTKNDTTQQEGTSVKTNPYELIPLMGQTAKLEATKWLI